LLHPEHREIKMPLELKTEESVRQYLKNNNLFTHHEVTIDFMNDNSNVNYVYKIKTGKEEFYLKYYPDLPKKNTLTIQKIGYTAKRFDKEVGALKLLKNRILVDIPNVVPTLEHVNKVDRVIILSDISQGGACLQDYLLTDFDVAKVENVLTKVALLNAQQHAQTRGHKNFSAYFDEDHIFNRRIYDFGTLVSCEKLPMYEQDRIKNKADYIYSKNKENYSVLINNDLSPKHIFVRPDHGIGMCDFEIMALGVASFDVGFFIANMMIIKIVREDYQEKLNVLIKHFLEIYFMALQKQGMNQNFIDFTFQHLGFFIGTGMLNRIDAVPLEPHILESKITEIRSTGVDYIFNRRS
jgi:5-methylthioribose kinase